MKFIDDPSVLLSYADRYQYPLLDSEIISLAKRVRAKGEFDIDDIARFTLWKSPRIGKKIRKNDSQLVKDVSDIVFRSKHPKVKMEGLTIIHGVGYPVASTILHFIFPDEFVIIDVRALWSLGESQPKLYTYEFYERYNSVCKILAKELNVPPRIVDKGLWQYSKENEKR